jgi:hypothetical protein
MSFNRLTYDTCSYVHDLDASLKVGEYMINTPFQDQNCFFPNPYIRLNNNGASICDSNLIDVDSELSGLNVKATKCPSKKFIPSNKPFCNFVNMKECSFLSPEDTKLSNPACTLRGTGWNRWEWLCEDPQTHVLMPFETGVNNRIVVKDNHRPCIPTPMDVDNSLPTKQDEHKDAFETPLEDWTTYHGTNVPFFHWRCCGEIQKL